MKHKKKWTRFRHRVITEIARLVLDPYTRIKYGVKVEKFKEQKSRQYLILLNHQTTFDQFFVGMAFKGPIYYVATEDIFSMGWISRLLSWAIAPIPIRKQTTDVHAVMNCIRVAREGGTIALAPEGNRTYSGKTEYMNPAIVKLAKKLSLPIAIFRIEGGYGVQPRWCDDVRKGKMRAYVSRVVEPEEYKALSDDELYKLIKSELYVNEASLDGSFYHENSAQYLERAIYVCPECGLSEFESHKDTIECKKCGIKVKYLPTKKLCGVEREFPFKFVNDWYEYQVNFISKLELNEYAARPMYRDKASICEVIVYDKKVSVAENADIELYGNKIVMHAEGLPDMSFENLSAVTVLGRNKLNIYVNDKIYQLKGSKRFNALKYVNVFYHYKNVREGSLNEQFLGL